MARVRIAVAPRWAAALLGAAVLTAACTSSGDASDALRASTAAASGTASTAPAAAPSTASTAPATTSAPSSSAPTTTAAPTTTTEPMLGPGANGPKVLALQTRLAELGYNPGSVDGAFGGGTSSAVMAFQKVEGLSADGVPGPETLGRLERPQGSMPSGGGLRIEIDLGRQVLFVVGAGRTRAFNTSTGNNEPFSWPDGTPALAYTPKGNFSVYYRYDGVFEGVLGNMYRPLYFTGDWAVHGSGYVPAYPASHGCARVSNADQDWIWAHVPGGTPVVVY